MGGVVGAGEWHDELGEGGSVAGVTPRFGSISEVPGSDRDQNRSLGAM